MRGKHDEVLQALLDSIRKRDGEARVKALSAELKSFSIEGANRELVCQVLSREKIWTRLKFFCLYPEYIVPYLMKIEKLPS